MLAYDFGFAFFIKHFYSPQKKSKRKNVENFSRSILITVNKIIYRGTSMPCNGSREPDVVTFTLINASVCTKCLIKLINLPASGDDDTADEENCMQISRLSSSPRACEYQ